MHSTLIDSKLDFSFLDKQAFQARYAYGGQKASMRFHVSGMSCSKCIRKLESLPETVPGLLSLRIVMGPDTAYVDIDPSKTTFSKVAVAITALGFTATPLLPEGSAEELEKKAKRQELIRIAIAGACAGNIMTFSFANYFGNTAEFKPLFLWLSFLVFLPVVFYVAVPFYRGAIASLRQRQLSIDLPMAVASLSGAVFSTIQLIRGHDDIYFDSISGFLFLILVSRAVQSRLQRRFTRADQSDLQMSRYRVFRNDDWEWAPSFAIGQRLLIAENEVIPADCDLESPTAHLSLAWLSGESRPKTFLNGAFVPAGARLTSPQAVVRVQRLLHETHFGKLMEEIQKFGLEKSQVMTQADRWSQWLLAIVFTVATVIVISFWASSPEEGIRRALALIIVACPCAMAFGTPLALATALRRCQKSGLVVRNANVFDEVRKLETVFFDKTGTLTDAELALVEDPRTVPPAHQALVLGLENRSFHPIAFAFRDKFSVPVIPIVDQWKEIPGHGVSGYIQDRFYELKRDNNQSTNVSCSLFEDGIVLETFMFEAPVKPDAQQVLESLRQTGLNVVMMSGDKSSSVFPLAQRLGFEFHNTLSELSPEEKAYFVTKNRNSMMVGDGINDSLALMRANVGVATSGSLESALNSASVYLSKPELGGILRLREISFQVDALIKSNLFLSVSYNIVAGWLALTGNMNPFLAAVLMPVSSGIIVVHTLLRGSK